MFRVASWNLASNARAKQYNPKAVASVIANQNPHVIALQEVRRDKLNLTLIALKQRGWHCEVHLAVSRNLSATRRDTRDYGVAILARRQSHRVLSQPTQRALWAPHLAHPGYALRMIADPGHGDPVYVYSLHLAVDTTSLDQVVDAHAFCAGGGSPRKVVAGDFNLERPQLESTFYADYVEVDESSPTPTYQRKNDGSWAKIDHIFLHGGLAASRVVVPNTHETSDHRPIVADLVI